MTDHKYDPSLITKVMYFDVARHLCHNKDDGQHFREAGPKGSKVICIIFTHNPYNKGDAQQQRVTFVRVTLERFLHSEFKFNKKSNSN